MTREERLRNGVWSKGENNITHIPCLNVVVSEYVV